LYGVDDRFCPQIAEATFSSPPDKVVCRAGGVSPSCGRGGGAWISTKKRPFGSGMMAARVPPCKIAGSPPLDTTERGEATPASRFSAV